MQTYGVEGPKKRKSCDMSAWHRVKDAFGATVAYTPDEVTAGQIADLFNDIEDILCSCGSVTNYHTEDCDVTIAGLERR